MTYMQQVVHVIDGIYLGGVPALRQKDYLQKKCVTHVLKLFATYEVYVYPDPMKAVIPTLPSLADELATMAQDFVIYDLPQPLNAVSYNPISAESFQRGVGFIRKQIKAGNHVLVMSRERTARAPIFVLAYMIEERGYTLPDAFSLVVKRNMGAGIGLSPQPWQSFLDYYHLPYTFDDLWRWLFE